MEAASEGGVLRTTGVEPMTWFCAFGKKRCNAFPISDEVSLSKFWQLVRGRLPIVEFDTGRRPCRLEPENTFRTE